jgi:hypothetical protein
MWRVRNATSPTVRGLLTDGDGVRSHHGRNGREAHHIFGTSALLRKYSVTPYDAQYTNLAKQIPISWIPAGHVIRPFSRPWRVNIVTCPGLCQIGSRGVTSWEVAAQRADSFLVPCSAARHGEIPGEYCSFPGTDCCQGTPGQSLAATPPTARNSSSWIPAPKLLHHGRQCKPENAAGAC